MRFLRYFAVLVCLLAVGCGVNRVFTEAVSANWAAIGPEYVAYVEADPGLSPGERRSRLLTAELMDALIAEAQKEN